MKNKKGLIIVIIIILLMVLIAGGAFAYVVTFTDLLKSNEEIFVEYLGENIGKIMFLQDDDIVTYVNKQLETPYQTSGNINIKSEGEEFLNIDTKGNVDKSQNYNLQKVMVNYSEDVSADINYLQTKDYIAIKIPDILRNYLVLENSNLKEFAQNIGISDVDEIPDSINWNNSIRLHKFNNTADYQIKEKYLDIILSKITPEMMNKSTTEQYTRYTLTTTKQNIKAILNDLLTTIKNDEEFINTLKNDYMENNQANETETQEYIDNVNETMDQIIAYCQETSEDDSSDIEISVDVKDKELINTEIVDELSKISINFEDNKLNISLQDLNAGEYEEIIKLTVEKIREENNLTYVVNVTTEDNNATLKLQFEGLTEEETKENISFDLNDQEVEVNYEQNKKFVDSISTGDIPESERTVLNNYDGEQLQQVMERLLENVIQLHMKKMLEAGNAMDPISSSIESEDM